MRHIRVHAAIGLSRLKSNVGELDVAGDLDAAADVVRHDTVCRLGLVRRKSIFIHLGVQLSATSFFIQGCQFASRRE